MMKKLALIFLSVMAFNLAEAKDNGNSEKALNLGIKFGYLNSKYTIQNITNLDLGGEKYTFDDFKQDTKNGFQLGAMARLNFGRLFLQPEAYYAMKRGSTSFNALGIVSGDKATVSQELELKNLDVPVLLSFRLLDLKIAKINLFAGPMASFVMNKSVQVKTEDTDWQAWEPENAELKNAQWNAQFGVGVDIMSLTVDVRYEMGLSSATKGYFETKTDFLTFSLAWRIFS